MAQQTGTAPDGTPVEGVAGEDAAPIDLRQQEGDPHGGHTIKVRDLARPEEMT